MKNILDLIRTYPDQWNEFKKAGGAFAILFALIVFTIVLLVNL